MQIDWEIISKGYVIRPPSNVICKGAKGSIEMPLLCEYVNWSFKVLGLPGFVSFGGVGPTSADYGSFVMACQKVMKEEGLVYVHEPVRKKKRWF